MISCVDIHISEEDLAYFYKQKQIIDFCDNYLRLFGKLSICENRYAFPWFSPHLAESVHFVLTLQSAFCTDLATCVHACPVFKSRSVKMQHRHNQFRVLQSDWLIG